MAEQTNQLSGPDAKVQLAETPADETVSAKWDINTQIDGEEQFQSLIGDGERSMEAGNPKEASKAFAAALELDPRDTRALLGRANALGPMD